MKIGFLHTAQVHVATFDALLAGSGVDTVHRVDENLLARAQADGVGAVRQDARYAVAHLQQADVVVCTCSTLGPLVDEMDAPDVLRIDRPAFERALSIGPHILMVVCLQSTIAPSEALLTDCGGDERAQTLLCKDAWAHFEAGDMPAFYETIANDVRDVLRSRPFDAVILAQASMAGAADYLGDVGLPVLSTPQMAVDAALARIR